MNIEKGQVYRSTRSDRRPFIRVVEYTPGSNRATVVDDATNKRPRSLLVSYLHSTPNNQYGRPWQTGYVLVPSLLDEKPVMLESKVVGATRVQPEHLNIHQVIRRAKERALNLFERFLFMEPSVEEDKP